MAFLKLQLTESTFKVTFRHCKMKQILCRECLEGHSSKEGEGTLLIILVLVLGKCIFFVTPKDTYYKYFGILYLVLTAKFHKATVCYASIREQNDSYDM